MKKKMGLHPFLLVFAVILLLAFIPSISSAANSGKFDLDIILVIDNSGSMLHTDPDRLALSASNLFIDMCEGSNTRIGYVMFTNEIVAEQPLADIATFSVQLKQSVSDTQYQSSGDTDIALGLQRAYELLARDALDGKSGRTPVVILLTDGNTDLPRGPRTTQESLEALEHIKTRYAGEGLPIYSIGFNYDGTLDVSEVESIAAMTGAVSREVKTADSLPAVLREIYGHLTGSNSRNTTITATGEPQSVSIPIDNSSIYKGTVTISSKDPLSDVSLVDPSGVIYDDNNLSSKVSVNKDPLGNYLIFTMYRPAKGAWTLNFTGSEDDIVLIDLMSVYDFALVMDDPVADIGEVKVSWHLEDATGHRIVDDDLMRDLVVTLFANDGDIELVFTPGRTSESFPLPPGDYEAYLTMENKDISGNKISNIRTFTIPSADSVKPVELLSSGGDVLYIKLKTIFKTTDVVNLRALIRYTSDNEPLSVSIKSGVWEDIVDLQSNSLNEIEATALKTGKAETVVTVVGADGSSVIIYIDTTVTSGWLYIIIIGVVLLILATVIFALISSRKPYLDQSMRDFAIEVKNLPDEIEYPQAARLRLEHVKAKRTLQQVILYNSQYADEYLDAFRDIIWFLNGMGFSAKRAGGLSIVIPVDPGYIVQVNGQKQTKPYIGVLNKNSELIVSLYRDENSIYEIILGNDSFGGGGPGWDDDFGGGFSGGYGAPDQGGYGGVSPDDFDLV